MKIQHLNDVPSQDVTMEGSLGCQVKWLVGQPEGAPNFALRQFEVAPGGFTPRHSHPYEHEVYVQEGQGLIVDGNRERTIGPGDVVYVAPHDVHQFRNAGDAPLKFLCIVPHVPKDTPVTLAPECEAVAGRS